MTARLFRWSRETPVEWLTALHRIAPPVEQASHLTLLWAAGTPADPIQRWIIYQAVPAHLLGPGRLAAFLHYAPCRCPAYPADARGWDRPCEHCGRRPSGDRNQVLQYYLQTGCLAAPFWVLQGSAGGHKWTYSPEEAAWARWAELPDQPPTPGDLPYAEFDERVVRKLRAYDHAQRAQRTLAAASEAERARAERDLRRAMLKGYATEAEDTVKGFWGTLGGDTRRVDDPTPLMQQDDDWVDEQWVETGHVHSQVNPRGV